MTEFEESIIRITVFLGVFIFLAILEIVLPYKKNQGPQYHRWFNNIAMIVVGSVLLRFVFPAAAVGIALAVEKNNWGLLNYYQLPGTVKIVVAVILLDLSVYLQHVIFHTLPLLWRLHVVHHTDHRIDVTTGLRFHPFEILVSMLVKFMTIAALGAPVIAVVVFEIVLNAMSMFTHSNIDMNPKLEKLFRLVFVTPNMHWTHHSTRHNETNSNFGFSLSIWDRLFGTYVDKPENGYENLEIGLTQFNNDPKWKSFRWLLYLPFLNDGRASPPGLYKAEKN